MNEYVTSIFKEKYESFVGNASFYVIDGENIDLVIIISTARTQKYDKDWVL